MIKKFLILCTTFFVYNEVFANIKVVISSNNPVKLSYHKPLFGYNFYYNYFNAIRLYPDSVSNNYYFFNIQTENTEIITLNVCDESDKVIELKQNSTRSIRNIYVFNESKDLNEIAINLMTNLVSFSGVNAKGMEFLNNEVYNESNDEEISRISLDYVNQKLYLQEYKNLLVSKDEHIDNLLNNGFITNEFDNVLKKQIHVYYFNMAYDLLLRNNRISNAENQVLLSKILNLQQIDSSYYRLLGGSPFFLNINNLKFLSTKSDYRVGDTMYKINNEYYYINSMYRNYFFYSDSLKLKEDCLAVDILTNFLKYSVDTSAILYFSVLFPQSKWLKYMITFYDFKAELNKNTLSFCHINYKLESDVVFKQTTPINFLQNNDFNSINDILLKFKNKAIFINLWTTWCKNCLMEFQFNKELDSFLNKNNIVKLYIVLDNIFLHDQWLNYVNKYKLGGYHIFPNNNLKEDILLLTKSQLYLPMFILFNKQGKLISSAATWPSETGSLKLIEEMFR